MSDPCRLRFTTWIDQKTGGAMLGEVVVASEYEAAKSQLAALREELAQSEIRSGGKSKLIDSLSSRLERATEKCASLVDRNARLKWQRNGTRLKLDEVEQRLADAERRNAVMRDALEVAEEQLLVAERHLDLGQDDSICFESAILTVRAALNPKPEAASHDE